MPSGNWRIFLCDKLGNPISNITTVAENRKFIYALNQPSSFTFTVDSSSPKIARVHDDGAPVLDYIRRVVKAYRLEIVEGIEQYVLRFAGFVWPVKDEGDSETQTTVVTCYDPLIVLPHRFARNASGAWTKVEFGTQSSALIWKTLVDRTNIFAGPSGLTTTGGSFPAVATAAVAWEYKMLSECFAELTKQVDIWCDPLDTRGANEHGRVHVAEPRGVLRPNLILGWRAAPHNLDGVARTMDPADACNVLVGVGSAAGDVQLSAVGVDPTNAANFMQLEALQTYSDVRDQPHMNQLVASDLADRLPHQEVITCKPFEGIDPWTHFDVGDRGYVVAGTELRGGVAKREERIFGFTLTQNDEGDDDLELVTQKEAA
jgi:hypothetical protein